MSKRTRRDSRVPIELTDSSAALDAIRENFTSHGTSYAEKVHSLALRIENFAELGQQLERAIPRLTSLTSLTVTVIDEQYPTAELVQLLLALPTLSALTQTGGKFGDTPHDAQRSHCKFERVTFSSIRVLHSFTRLEALILSKCTLADNSSWDNIAGTLSQLPALRLLQISYQGLHRIPDVRRNPLLTRLHLQGNQIDTLVIPEPLANITELNVRANKLASLTGLRRYPNLRTLWADHNQLTSLLDVESLAYLATVGLADNQLADISPLLLIATLREAILYENQIPLPQLELLMRHQPPLALIKH